MTEEFVSKRSPDETEEDNVLIEYLEGLKLQLGKNEEVLLPDEGPPEGFDLTFRRCCRRTRYPDGDFAIIVSKEVSCQMDERDEATVETVCMPLLVDVVALLFKIKRWN